MLKRSRVCGVCSSVALICLGFTACQLPESTENTPPQGPVTLTIGYPHITGEDPLYGLPQAARPISFEGLVATGEDGHPQARLAESWTASSDGLIWKIQLRPNAKFHDGTPVTAIHVKNSLERTLASSNRDLTPGLSDIAAIETPSASRLTIRLRGRSTFLLDDLNTPIVKLGPRNTQIGAGPYVVVSSSSTELLMKAVPNYYRGALEVSQIVWKVYPTVRTAWAAMMRGEIDFLHEVAPDTLEFIRDEASIQVFPFLRPYVYGVMFNSGRPMFRDRRIRQALNYAVNRAPIVDQVFKGHAYAANGPTWPGHWAHDSTIPKYSYDPSRAVALLDSANVPASFAGVNRPPARLHFTCILPENFALWERMALLVQRNLSEIGIDMELETMPFDVFSKRVVSQNFDAAFSELVVGRGASRPYIFWHSSSKQNFAGFRSLVADASLEGIKRAASEPEYRDAFRSFQLEILEDPPAIFLVLGENNRAVSRRFQVLSTPRSDILYTIADWRLSSTSLSTTN